MKQLFEMDLKDYKSNDKIYKRPSARGIILDENGKIALVYSKKEKYFKFPGGGIIEDEDKKEAGFVLKYVDFDEAIRVKSDYKTKDYFNEIMIKRDTKVLELIKKFVKSN